MKACTKCGETKPFSDFHQLKRGGYRAACRSCTSLDNGERNRRKPEARTAAVLKWNHANPSKVRATHVKRTYGLTEDDYDLMRLAQDDSCAICHEPFKKTPHVDHCHVTGRVRALTCSQCNTMLGMAKDSPDRLRAAASYLEFHEAAYRETIE